jgi:tetratricopeptide (TPR) repeat protein
MAFALWLALAAASPQEQDEARALIRAAKDQFDAGDFARAAALLSRARALVPTPATVYNLGRARERAGELPGAIEAYREYLALQPGSSDRKAVEATIEDLERRLDERKRLEALESAPPKVIEVAHQPPAPSRSLLPWVLGGLGVGGIGAGIALGLNADALHARAQAEPQFELSHPLQVSAERYATAANVAYVAAGVALGAGILWLVLERALEKAGP